jgi:penicillin-binding protein-related factor A (putative recombinase)
LSEGKIFESSFESSCKSQKIFYHRIKDVFLPPKLRNQVRLPKNKYDCLLFHDGYLLPIEFKSGKGKSFSFSESIIKEHQIKSLQEATEYEKTIPGFIFNFRSTTGNETYFIHIHDFIKYKGIAEAEFSVHNYCKLNKSSIPLEVCKQVGIEIHNEKKRTRYSYDVKRFIDEAVDRFG